MQLVAVVPLKILPGAGRAELQAITPPGAGEPEAQVVGPPDADGVRALMVAPLGTGGSVAPVVADAEGYLVQRMALDAVLDTGVLSQRDILI